MKRYFLALYGIAILIISLGLISICMISGHKISLGNPWMFFYATNLLFSIFIFINGIISQTRIWNYKYFKPYLFCVVSSYILMTFVSLGNFVRSNNLVIFDLIIAILLILLSVFAIMNTIILSNNNNR